jgi:hypothetical protein
MSGKPFIRSFIPVGSVEELVRFFLSWVHVGTAGRALLATVQLAGPKPQITVPMSPSTPFLPFARVSKGRLTPTNEMDC